MNKKDDIVNYMKILQEVNPKLFGIKICLLFFSDNFLFAIIIEDDFDFDIFLFLNLSKSIIV